MLNLGGNRGRNYAPKMYKYDREDNIGSGIGSITIR